MVAKPRKEVEKPEGSKWPWIRELVNFAILKGAAHLPKRSRSPRHSKPNKGHCRKG